MQQFGGRVPLRAKAVERGHHNHRVGQFQLAFQFHAVAARGRGAELERAFLGAGDHFHGEGVGKFYAVLVDGERAFQRLGARVHIVRSGIRFVLRMPFRVVFLVAARLEAGKLVRFFFRIGPPVYAGRSVRIRRLGLFIRRFGLRDVLGVGRSLFRGLGLCRRRFNRVAAGLEAVGAGNAGQQNKGQEEG